MAGRLQVRRISIDVLLYRVYRHVSWGVFVSGVMPSVDIELLALGVLSSPPVVIKPPLPRAPTIVHRDQTSRLASASTRCLRVSIGSACQPESTSSSDP
jgi:hypothetical protein